MTRRLTAAALLALAAPAAAQPPAPSPLVAPPQAPTLNPAPPYGVPRGGRIELALTGTNLADPLAVLTSFPARATFPADANNGKDAARLRVVLEVPADAPVGVHTLRVATKSGVSNLRPLCLDELPLSVEQDTNHAKATAQAVPVPAVVAGRADAELSDFFRVALKPGQRLCAEVVARRMGSPLDPVLFLHDARSGMELAVTNDDAPGLQGDSRLVYATKDGGDFLVEVRDSTYRGGGDYTYRLRLGDFPLATTPLPAAVQRGVKTSVAFAGANLDGVAPVAVTAPADPAVPALAVAPRGPAQAGWPVTVALSDFPEALEQEPNDDPAKANRLPAPGGVTGRFLTKGELDHFVFAAKKGTKYVVTAQTAEIGSPAEVYLTAKDAKGAELGKSNPQQAPPRLELTPAADGDVVVAVEHLNFAAGPHEAYRLTVVPDGPRLAVELALDRVAVAPGATTVVPVQAIARGGFDGPVELTVSGPPGLTGSVTLPAGSPAPAPGQPVALLPLTAKPDVAPGAYELRVVARGTAGGKPVVADVAGYRPLLSQLFGNLAVAPAELDGRLAVGVTETPPFQLALRLGHPDAYKGGTAVLTAAATRLPNFAEEITLAAAGLPVGVPAPKVANVAKGKAEGTVTLTIAANTPPGAYALTVVGKAKFNGREYLIAAAPATLTVGPPVVVKVTPPAKLAPGGKAKLAVAVERKGGYAGPLTLAVQNLPAGVTAAAATVDAGKDAAEVELTAAATAAVGSKEGVVVQATATGAGNQVQPSPAFALVVGK